LSALAPLAAHGIGSVSTPVSRIAMIRTQMTRQRLTLNIRVLLLRDANDAGPHNARRLVVVLPGAFYGPMSMRRLRHARPQAPHWLQLPPPGSA
jgi:hypothetical protein